MKRKIFLLLIIILLAGCSKFDESSYKVIIDQVLSSNLKLHNESGQGYNYYLPKHVSLYKVNDTNSILLYNNYKFYMYVDTISYYNKVASEFNEDKQSYYSQKIDYNGTFGYLQISKYKSGYFVEMMYNYGKIEALVNSNDLNDAIYNMITILSSISYNDTIVSSLVGSTSYNYKEEIYNIFKPIDVTDNYLIFEEDIYDDYDGEIIDEDKLIIEDKTE